MHEHTTIYIKYRKSYKNSKANKEKCNLNNGETKFTFSIHGTKSVEFALFFLWVIRDSKSNTQWAHILQSAN